MTNKPPLGLRPRYIARNDRLEEIYQAIRRYVMAGKPVPQDWLTEYNELAQPGHSLTQCPHCSTIFGGGA